jgi:NitT/TauT family transport system ATP-binding protein
MAGAGGAREGAEVSVDRLVVEYRSRASVLRAIAPTSVRVRRGEFVSVIGPSGCGKSTLLKVVAGLLPATEGAVSIDGHPVTRPYPRAGMVFQEPVLLDWRTVLGNVLLQADVRRLDRRACEPRARELLHRVGLGEFLDRRPYELSGGMRQRVSICRALLHAPSLLLMDEPFGALDALTREQMATDLQRLWLELGMTVLFITHSIPEAILLSDRVVVFSARPGRPVADVRVDLPRPRGIYGVQEDGRHAEYATAIRESLNQAQHGSTPAGGGMDHSQEEEKP